MRTSPEDNISAFDNPEKSKLLNNYFCSISDLHDENIPLPDFDDREPNILTSIIISEQEVLDTISILDTDKAVGPDIISNKMLKEVKYEIAKPLSILFNRSLRDRKFPKYWKLANVIPLFKQGDKSLVSNYRPVALLSAVSKIFEKVVYKPVFNFLIENALLYKFQSGFLPGHATTHQLIELIHDIMLALDNHELICLIFCDVSKAFDRVWIRGLLLKLERYGIKGDLLKWMESYLTDREQRVVIKDAFLSKSKLKAGVPQGSVLGPLLFLIFINDIADDMLGLCRLFADDTSIRQKSYEIDSLKNMVHIDLNNISEWAHKWLVKMNPNKTEIVYFSNRVVPNDLFFNFDGIVIKPVQCHKHLGLTISSDCKWSSHINIVIEKAAKQIAVLRKLKFYLSRDYLEKIYLTFIRPLLEYSCEVWDNCTKIDSDRLEKLQLEAGRIVTGLTAFSRLSCIYDETGWEKLADRREQRKLTLFYNIVNGDAPDYLTDLLPRSVTEGHEYNLRNSNNFVPPTARLTSFQNSFLPSTTRLWNNLEPHIRNSPSNSIFKFLLKTKYSLPKPPLYFSCGNRKANILHTRLRNNCSILKSDLYRCNLIDDCSCECNHFTVENVQHYFMNCNMYTMQRAILFSDIAYLGLEPDISVILYGSTYHNYETNVRLFHSVQKFIVDTKRFTI